MNNTASDLAKFEDNQDQYLAFLYACHIQISANASAVAGGEKLVINTVEGPQTFSGNTNSVRKFSVTQGEYKFSSDLLGLWQFHRSHHQHLRKNRCRTVHGYRPVFGEYRREPFQR